MRTLDSEGKEHRCAKLSPLREDSYLPNVESLKQTRLQSLFRSQTRACRWIIYIYITYIHTYVHTYIHTYIHAYIHTYINTLLYTYIYIYVSTYISIGIFIMPYIYVYRERGITISKRISQCGSYIYIYVCVCACGAPSSCRLPFGVFGLRQQGFWAAPGKLGLRVWTEGVVGLLIVEC